MADIFRYLPPNPTRLTHFSARYEDAKIIINCCFLLAASLHRRSGGKVSESSNCKGMKISGKNCFVPNHRDPTSGYGGSVRRRHSRVGFRIKFEKWIIGKICEIRFDRNDGSSAFQVRDGGDFVYWKLLLCQRRLTHTHPGIQTEGATGLHFA